MAKKVAKKLTDELRAAVAGCGMTLGDLTRATGIDKSALSRFVNGERGLSMEAMDALGQCLGLSIVAGKPKATPQPGKLRGAGVFRGNEAIDALKRIPKDDPERQRAWQIVLDWIKANK